MICAVVVIEITVGKLLPKVAKYFGKSLDKHDCHHHNHHCCHKIGSYSFFRVIVMILIYTFVAQALMYFFNIPQIG